MTIPDKENLNTPAVAFRWSYITLPTVILAISLILSAVFYSRLNTELAYHFRADGSPDRWMGRNQLIMVILLPQVVLTLIAAATAFIITRLSSRLNQMQIAVKPEKPVLSEPSALPALSGVEGSKANGKVEGIVSLMGNIVALPEIVLAFFLLDVFLFNAFQIHFMTIWVIGATVMITGGIILGIFFFKAFREARRTTK